MGRGVGFEARVEDRGAGKGREAGHMGQLGTERVGLIINSRKLFAPRF